jgi:GTP-binding protein EngB required for normal cell division
MSPASSPRQVAGNKKAPAGSRKPAVGRTRPAFDHIFRELDDHLAFAGNLLSSGKITADRRLAGNLDEIRRRRRDPNLYLAVVGEFSTGKSTLINALIGADLLPTSALLTTGAITEVVPGQAKQLEVISAAGRKSTPTRTRTAQKADGNPGRTQLTPASIRKQLTDLATDPVTSAKIGKIRLTWPAVPLGENVVIIDTPGLNSVEKRHFVVTERVVREQADAFVVLTSASDPVPQSLVDFIQNYLADQLSRCVFVVTKLDWVDEAERKAVVDHVRRRIARISAGPLRPTIKAVALGPALKDEGSKDHWLEQFDLLCSALRDELGRERAAMIAVTLARLLEQALTAIQGKLKQRTGQISAERAALAGNKLRDVSAFCRELGFTSALWIGEHPFSTASWVTAHVAKMKHDLNSEIEARIPPCNSSAALKAFAQSFGPLVGRRRERLVSEATATADDLVRKNTSMLESKQQIFLREYQRIKVSRPGVQTRSPITPPTVSNRPPAMTAAVSSVNAASALAAAKVGAGAAVGALIGTLVAPGIGSLIGGIIGGLAGSGGSHLQKAKNSAALEMRKEVERVSSEMEKLVGEYRDAVVAAERSRAARVGHELEARYGPSISAIVSDAQQSERRLSAEVRTLQNLTKQVKDRITTLGAMRQTLTG